MTKTKSGFTIVELLIVVVIIAILAAITIVAYNGLQDRANRTSQIQAATQIAKRINAAVVSDGLNVGSGGLPYCVPGTAKDTDSDGIADCSGGGTQRVAKATADSLFAAAKITGLQFPDTVIANNNNTKSYGIQITYGSAVYGVDGVHQPFFLYFTIKGIDQDCGSGYSVGGKAGNDNINSPLTALTYKKNYSSNYGGNTICAYTISMPQNS